VTLPSSVGIAQKVGADHFPGSPTLGGRESGSPAEIRKSSRPQAVVESILKSILVFS